ncbi:hypothetical protein Syun_000895 [Stephania yunnanensis]|uniref:transketolase n=1 Tax=Stephania yunnanensis TaxID=152371 RepID=A0AAP0LDT5_9MAGN
MGIYTLLIMNQTLPSSSPPLPSLIHIKPFHNPHKILTYPTKPTRFQIFTCSTNTHHNHRDDDKVLWEEELERAFGSNYIKELDDDDDDKYNKLVDQRCIDNVRMLVVDSVQSARAGHPGMALGMADVVYVLYRHFMRYNAKNPKWFNRDRFVLSAGHGCLLQYVCLHLAGFSSVQIEDLKRLCKLGSRTPGHPENVVTDGIEVTTGVKLSSFAIRLGCPNVNELDQYKRFYVTGPLGQGVANAVGLALAEAHLAARFNEPDAVVVDHRTYCIMGDGCAMEGVAHEAASLAAHWKLNKLTLIYDDNHNTIDGDTGLAFSEDISARFEALGWNTISVNNVHEDQGEFKRAILSAFSETERPTFIKVKTLIGKLSVKEGTSKAHHGTFDDADVKQMRQKIKWEDRKPFHVLPMEWSISDPVDATRGYSEECLNHLAKVLPGVIGGSADLASSNKAYLHGYGDFRQPKNPQGRNIRYGVREHAMAAISNGIALHGGGLIPFAATFLIFSDYMKNSIRLSALSHAGVIYIMTHDSIGLGEDGPTHQPVEQLAGLRAIPRLLLFRPADGNETAGAYRMAVKNRDAPSVIALSRQKVNANLAGTSIDAVERGGYVLSDNSKEDMPDVILIGTGSELCLCEGSAEDLREQGWRVRVVSLVCWRLFDEQSCEYKESVLPKGVAKRVSVEAGSPLGWREYVGNEGVVIGVESFGASGAYLDTFKKFGFTQENVTNVARALLHSSL